ncbi:beta-glucosidase [bacterium A37T11]|nr:beta-glucosidase [bacterium A37T11]
MVSSGLFAQQKADFISFINTDHPWVDSVFNKLSKKERIAQLFMVRAHTNLGQDYIDSVAKVIRKEKLGGVVLFQGGLMRHADLINNYQKQAKVPLLFAIDGEWGLGMRLPDSTISYPYQMTLGAVQNDSLIYQMGREVALDFKRLGLQVNFAPVVDINNNPRNPVINFRSFGENKENVTRKGLAYMRGMMDGGLIVTLKHFPGHGDTDVDSHKDLPQLPFNRVRLDSLEMVPFKELVKAGASGVMVAHMNIPSLDSTAHLPSSLSQPIITGILKNELGFKGLIFTDAMDMKGVVKYFPDGEADVRAVIAGDDVLELSENSKRAIKMVQKAIRKKLITQPEIDLRVKKILAAKLWAGLDHGGKVKPIGLYSGVNRPASLKLQGQLADAAITLLKGDSAIHQLNYSLHTALISIGSDSITPFQLTLKDRFPNSTQFLLAAQASSQDIDRVAGELRKFKQVIVGIHDSRLRPASTLIVNNSVIRFIKQTAAQGAFVSIFANPYSISGLPGIELSKSLIVAYQNNGYMQNAAARIIANQLVPSGKLPVSINAFFKYGDGL